MTAAAPPRPVILLVEDHADSLTMMGLLLRDVPCDVVLADCCDAARAAAAAHAGGLSLVVGDLGLPDGDGLDLLVELKRQYGCRTVALTGRGEAADVARCLGAGVDRHVLKPVSAACLRAEIAALAACGV